MSSSFQGYSPDGDAIALASPSCLAAREAFRARLQELKKWAVVQLEMARKNPAFEAGDLCGLGPNIEPEAWY